jgi:hypothetical protein
MTNQFKLTEQHITLLRNMYVRWNNCETGAPEIDPKRPYGNSYVPGDIHELLTGEDSELTEEEEKNYLKLHRETEEALRIFLANAKIHPENYSMEWTGWWEKSEEADVVNESDDYLIHEWYNTQDLQVYFSIVNAMTKGLVAGITPRIKTFEEAKGVVMNLRKYKQQIYHTV